VRDLSDQVFRGLARHALGSRVDHDGLAVLVKDPHPCVHHLHDLGELRDALL
jgi:hypothetical protein